MQLYDTLALDGTALTKDGYLTATARVARTGIQLYTGDELGRPDLGIVRVYRAPEEVFSGASRFSLAGRPITNDHPREGVNASNWRDLAVGIVGGATKQDGEWLMAPIAITDEAMVRQVRGGKRELSCGYQCDVEFTPGTTPEGEAYDARQVNIRQNHLAVVDAGRASLPGQPAAIGDRTPYPAASAADPAGTGTTNTDGTTPKETSMETMQLDGVPIQVADAAAKAVIEKAITDAGKALAAETKRANDAEAEAATEKKRAEEAEEAKVAAEAEAEVARKAAEEAERNAPELAKTEAEDRAFIAKAAPNLTGLDAKPIADARAAYVDAEFGADEKREAAVTDALFAASKKRGAASPTPTNDAKPNADKRQAYMDRVSGKTKKEAA